MRIEFQNISGNALRREKKNAPVNVTREMVIQAIEDPDFAVKSCKIP